MTQRELAVSLGKKDDFAVIERTWRGTFEQLVERLLKNVKDTEDKAVRGMGVRRDVPARVSTFLQLRSTQPTES